MRYFITLKAQIDAEDDKEFDFKIEEFCKKINEKNDILRFIKLDEIDDIADYD